MSSASGIACCSRVSARPRIGARRRAQRERAEVLELEEAVAGSLEPVERLEPEALGVVDLAEVVLDETKLKRHARLIAEAAELRGERG